jgi:hypothetical protein
MFSGTPAGELLGIDALMADGEIKTLPMNVKRVVLVGNKISPGNPSVKSDGTVVKTLWGELVWQLGGRKAFDNVRQDDERATSPGDMLRALMNEYGPCDPDRRMGPMPANFTTRAIYPEEVLRLTSASPRH